MKFLLDTNAVSALLRNHIGIWSRLHRMQPTDIAISAIVAHELFYGAHRGRRTEQTLTQIDELPFAILPFDAADAHRAGEIRAALSLAGTPIGPYDVLIAGQASQRGLVLVTRNLREFRRVPRLTVEDWEVEDIVH
ncbi:PIN domain-containing protein [Methylobacterium sp. Gmos1]